MGLKFGSIIEKKNLKTGGYAPAYILLGSRRPKVFLLNNDGYVFAMDLSHLEMELRMRRLRWMLEVEQ